MWADGMWIVSLLMLFMGFWVLSVSWTVFYPLWLKKYHPEKWKRREVERAKERIRWKQELDHKRKERDRQEFEIKAIAEEELRLGK